MPSQHLSKLRRGIRWNLARGCGPPRRVDKTIAILGIPRSGTSWLGKALSLAKHVNYFYEPDRSLPKEFRYRFLPKQERDQELKACLRSMLDGEVTAPHEISEWDLKDILQAPWRRTALVKWVWLCQASEWIAYNFPNLRGVQLVRHPAPLMLSRRDKGWNVGASLDILLTQEKLMNGPLQRFADHLHGMSTEWEKAGGFWAATVYLQLEATKTSRRRWILREHEWYCEDPVPRLRWLIDELELEWTNDVERFIDGRSGVSGSGYHQWRDSRSELRKWQHKISPQELSDLKRGAAPFDLPIYPDLDPYTYTAQESVP